MKVHPLHIDTTACIQCEACIGACSYNALSMGEYPEIDADACQLCNACVSECPTEAITIETANVAADDLSQFAGIWVLCELNNGAVNPVTLQLLGKACELAQQNNEIVSAVVLGTCSDAIRNELIASGADQIYHANHDGLDAMLENRHAEVLADLAQCYKPSVILIGATSFGRGVSARAAARLQTGLTADCTELRIDNATGNLLQQRPAFGGNLLATIETPHHRPQMASVRPGVMQAQTPDFNRKGLLIEHAFDAALLNDGVTLLEEHADTTPKQRIEDADVLIAAGKGIQGKEHVGNLERLAGLLGGMVAGSRAAVEAGWISVDRQVGQTGKSVSPRVYIACGISGQIQHTSGMNHVKTVIAINNDPDAPIFEMAHYGIVGNAQEIVPELIQILGANV